MSRKTKAEAALEEAREAVAAAQRAVDAERRAKAAKSDSPEPQRILVQKGDERGGTAPVIVRCR